MQIVIRILLGLLAASWLAGLFGCGGITDTSINPDGSRSVTQRRDVEGTIRTLKGLGVKADLYWMLDSRAHIGGFAFDLLGSRAFIHVHMDPSAAQPAEAAKLDEPVAVE